ncbi:phosphoglycan beta 1,3 galactosyltransferase [Leishmania major strain Friedlin]|uniref:Phosphoglycan beta 1,3 galactosyltransferase n=1 Tax=Leishmania major TaxID=5664 RepID=E9AC95_LEIMA|nr:phosphoglycan beta 1,3 galactosyltransferase [Leishmania major strain Friedlin]CAG9567171.1 phosphoglycan_beta_1_-3_galactosyltransferase [Leishmania major strain Friedlin]CBZ11910.1 phosphoglycan beta 1,3 galactosyltransferase [Leishmania major strain Friedlin]|eukprot:XP_003721626.1 phosphoglycan beta 1,3 galactosyltransferase [Leishmania major strain Friedlin]
MRLDATRMWRRRAGPRKRPAGLLVDMALYLSCLLVMWWLLRWLKRSHQPSEAQLVRHLGRLSHPWAVVVQHEDAVGRLSTRVLEEERRARCGRGPAVRVGACNASLLLSPHMLPSWTLRVVERDCADCTDRQTHDSAVQGVELQPQHAVYATSSAPLGRVGPMLLAMTSVTDDVNVRTELPQWEWLRHVYGEGFPTVGGAGEGAAQPRRPYLAVMGIPSTDQPARAALREAQRRTWLTYQEVARTENHFDATLLALYVFAAVEPGVSLDTPTNGKTTAAEPVRGVAHVTDSAKRCYNRSALLPNFTEYGAASQALAAGSATAGGLVEGVERRRVALRSSWQLEDVVSSPCDRVIRLPYAEEGAATPALLYLSGALSLPVTPAFTSPAEYVCHASSALWQEALTHRNVVWIDMMTDRRPTTNKKLGEDGKWGLPVEVGMSQKLILWLEYAYHAFKNVPFIIKGDDDSYVKVPQFLSDVRYVMGGTQSRQASLQLYRFVSGARDEAVGFRGVTKAVAPAAADADAYANVTPTLKAPSLVEEAECVYWGSLRHHLHTQFNAGMTFMMHRRVAQALLEPKASRHRLDIVRLAVEDFATRRTAAYRRIMFHHEDILIGLQIYRALPRVKELCPNGRLWYVKEWYARFHDIHVGRTHNVTWSTVVAHRCRPSDSYYLHYYFREEHRIAAATGRYATEEEHEAAAVQMAARWVTEMQKDPLMMTLNWSGLPDVQWARNISRRPPFTLAEGDGVAVYENRYEYWTHEATNIHDGYRSLPQW